MKNRDFTRSDLAAAHARHGENLRSNLERAQGELDRREAILERSPSVAYLSHVRTHAPAATHVAVALPAVRRRPGQVKR